MKYEKLYVGLEGNMVPDPHGAYAYSSDLEALETENAELRAALDESLTLFEFARGDRIIPAVLVNRIDRIRALLERTTK